MFLFLKKALLLNNVPENVVDNIIDLVTLKAGNINYETRYIVISNDFRTLDIVSIPGVDSGDVDVVVDCVDDTYLDIENQEWIDVK